MTSGMTIALLTNFKRQMPSCLRRSRKTTRRHDSAADWESGVVALAVRAPGSRRGGAVRTRSSRPARVGFVVTTSVIICPGDSEWNESGKNLLEESDMFWDDVECGDFGLPDSMAEDGISGDCAESTTSDPTPVTEATETGSEVRFGGSREACSGCQGTGHERCFMCLGERGKVWGGAWTECGKCDGTGQRCCVWCSGRGYIDR